MPIEQIIISLFPGFIGVLVGGFITFIIKIVELKLYEKATALSIIEELKVLKEEYEYKCDNCGTYRTMDSLERNILKYSTTEKNIIAKYLYENARTPQPDKFSINLIK